MTRVLLSLLLLLLSLLPAPGLAGELTPAELERCLLATVKIGVVDEDGDAIGSGSGAMIDGRGYVLTNFHVVGEPATGRLRHPQGEVLLGMTRSTSAAASYDWQGVVVRADPRLDLALLRVTGARSGASLEARDFPSIRLETEEIITGSPVWTFGYPSGARSVNTTTGVVAGLETNLEDGLSWIRTDAAFNPGNSGGLLVNERGRLIGVPTRVVRPDGASVLNPINLARAVARVPQRWLDELKAGDISDRVISGTFLLKQGEVLKDRIVGNDLMLNGPEIRYYVVERPVASVVVADSGLPMIVSGTDGKALRMGVGRVALSAADPRPTLVAIVVSPDTKAPLSYSLHMETLAATFNVPTYDPKTRFYVVPPDITSRFEEPLTKTRSALDAVNNNVVVAIYDDVVSGIEPGEDENHAHAAAEKILETWRESKVDTTEMALVLFAFDIQKLWVQIDEHIESRIAMQTVASKIESAMEGARDLDGLLSAFVEAFDVILGEAKEAEPEKKGGQIQVHAVDAMSGDPVPSTLLIGEPGVPLETLKATVEGVLSGKQPPGDLKALVGGAFQSSTGHFQIASLPTGQTYAYAIIAEGYRARFGSFEIGADGDVVDLGQIELLSRAL